MNKLEMVRALWKELSPKEKSVFLEEAKPSKKKGELLTTKQAAEYLSMNRETVLRFFRKNQLKALKRGERWIRFDKAELDRFLEDSVTGRAA